MITATQRRWVWVLLPVSILLILAPRLIQHQTTGTLPRNQQLVSVAKEYLQAIAARDFVAAYHYSSAADQRVWHESDYVQAQGAYSGFALKVAKAIADSIEVWPIEQTETNEGWRIKIGYRVPAPADLAGLLLNWHEAALDALSQGQQRQILTELDTRKKAGKLLFVDGQETFDLVNERKSWKIAFNWAAATKVRLKAHLPNNNELAVSFAATELLAKDDEFFLVNLVVKNRSPRSFTFTVSHRVDPQPVADDLELVECGLLAPITISAGGEQEFSMAYLLGARARKEFREFNLTYEFNIR
jgi:hypothetical protein